MRARALCGWRTFYESLKRMLAHSDCLILVYARDYTASLTRVNCAAHGCVRRSWQAVCVRYDNNNVKAIIWGWEALLRDWCDMQKSVGEFVCNNTSQQQQQQRHWYVITRRVVCEDTGAWRGLVVERTLFSLILSCGDIGAADNVELRGIVCGRYIYNSNNMYASSRFVYYFYPVVLVIHIAIGLASHKVRSGRRAHFQVDFFFYISVY